MIEIRHKTGSRDASRSCKDSGRFDIPSYKALTLGLLLLLVTAALTKVVISSNPGRSPNYASRDDHPQRAEPAATTDDEVRTRRSSAATAPIDDGESQARPDALAAPSVMNRLAQVIRQAGPREQATAAALSRFAAGGKMDELRRLDRQNVIALADHLAAQLAPVEVGALLQQTLGLSPDTVLTEENVSSSLVDIYDAVAGNRVEEIRPSVLMVTDAADADGRIIGQAHVLPVGTERVYAVFENDHALEGLDQVLAVWRAPGDDRMVFTEFEPVRQGAAYNYVWLEVESGWPEGRYQVELFHPGAQSLLLASESFSVR